MGKTGQRGRVVVVVVRGIAMAGTGGGMGVLHRAEEGAGTVGGGRGDADGHGVNSYTLNIYNGINAEVREVTKTKGYIAE